MEKVSKIKSKHGQRLGEKSIDNLKKKNSDTKLTSSGGESANCGGAASVGRGTRGSKQVSLFR